MPGKYLEFVKSGCYVVPVEITFLPTTLKDNGKDVTTSKWTTHSHWKEIKCLLQPAVESCTSSTADGHSTTPHISFGNEVGLGFVLCSDSNKEKSPFFTVLDSKRNCWTDDEADRDTRYKGLRDYGGAHRSYLSTKAYIKAAVIRRTASNVNDSRKLKKELGFKGEDLRSFFNNTISTSSCTRVSSIHDKEWMEGRNKRFGFGKLSGADMNEINPFTSSFSRRFAMERRSGATISSRNKRTYYIEQDDYDDNDRYTEADFHREKMDESEEDDDFSLPDIDTPQGDIQIRQHSKEMATAKKTKRKQAVNAEIYNDFPGSLRHNLQLEKDKNPRRVMQSSKQAQKTIRLVSPCNDEFAQKLGASVAPDTVSKTLDMETFTKSMVLPDPFVAKKLKEKVEKKARPKPNRNAGYSSEKRREYVIRIAESMRLAASHVLKHSNFRRADRKSLAKIGIRNISDKDSITKAEHIIEMSPYPSMEQSSQPEREGQDEDVLRNSDTLLSQPLPKVKRNAKAMPCNLLSRTYFPTGSDSIKSSSFHEQIPIQNTLKTTPDASNIKSRKPKRLSRIDVKKEKNSQPSTSFEFIVPDDIHLLNFEVDPDMPILSPVTEVVFENIPMDTLPTLKRQITVVTKAQKHKRQRQKTPFGKPMAVKDHAEKSTSTEDALATVFPSSLDTASPEVDFDYADSNRSGHPFKSHARFQGNKESDPLRMAENFMVDDDVAIGAYDTGNMSITKPIDLLQPATMMPPPSRPAPRTPKKNNSCGPQPRSASGDFTCVSMKLIRSNDIVDPSKLSTIQLMSNPRILRAGVGLLKTLSSNKKITIDNPELSDASDGRRERELSPDIALFHSASDKEKSTQQQMYPRRPQLSSALLQSEKSHSDEDFSDNDPDHHEEGNSLMQELLNRVNENSKSQDSYEPEGDGYDLSQRSMCYLNIIPEYSRKSRSCKIHCKNIVDLTFEKLLEHYIGIRPALRQIFEGEVPNIRSTTYLQGPAGVKRLKEMSVSIPFEDDQTSSIITMLLEYFIPDSSRRPKWSDYITYVLLPEALINIYARVNEITYAMAEKEMRYQGCYEDDS